MGLFTLYTLFTLSTLPTLFTLPNLPSPKNHAYNTSACQPGPSRR